jgi:hypothetical protein
VGNGHDLNFVGGYLSIDDCVGKSANHDTAGVKEFTPKLGVLKNLKDFATDGSQEV